MSYNGRYSLSNKIARKSRNMASPTLAVSGLPQEKYWSSCLCSTNTLYAPNSLATCCATFSRGLSLCISNESANCVLADHPRFKELLMGDAAGVCCIISTGEVTMVKPLFLSGDKPCWKTSSSGWCCASRCVFYMMRFLHL